MDIKNLAQLSDEELVELIRERGWKDDRPFAELFHRHQASVWRTSYRYAGNAHDAEDLTQEVFFKVYRGLARFERRSSFRTWLFRITVNTCQNALRKQKREPALAAAAVEDYEEVLPGDRLDNGDAERLSRRELLNEAFAKIKAEDREAVYLRDVEGRSFEDIAAMLDINLSAAKMRVYRTRLAIQKQFRMLEEGQEDT